jgi:hypothetical protein
MNIIDKRILIPASPEVIWGVLSTMENNPQWQVNCAGISFLTTDHQGQGMRYRAISDKGRDNVIEISAWYENVGYAYHIIDGSHPFRSNKGRLRLQEVTDGTIVQWVFEYELGGMLSGVRNALSIRRGLENDVVKSLENLWRMVTSMTGSKTYVSKTAMREAPDVEARSQYKPRHEAKVNYLNHQAESDSQAPSFIIDEPPIEESDTRPRPAAITPITPLAPVDELALPVQHPTPILEPDFLTDIDKSKPQHDDSIFQPPADVSYTSPPTPPSTKRVELDVLDENPVEEKSAEETPPLEPSYEYAPVPKVTDTATVSVFDLFGLPKPSETQQMPAVVLSEPKADLILPPTDSQVIPRVDLQASQSHGEIIGMRVAFRRRNIHIRRRK